VTAFGAAGRLVERSHRVWSRADARWHAIQERVPLLVAALRILYLPFALALVAYIAVDAASKIDLHSIRYWPLVFAYLGCIVWWLALAAGWSTLITERIEYLPMRAWCRTQATRYLPGGIWAPVTRATTVQGRIRDKATAVVAENFIVLAVALGIGALWATVHNPAWLPLAVVALLPIVAARWVERRTKVTRRGILLTSGSYGFGFVAYGVVGILTQIAVSGVRSPTYPLYVAGAACLAWAVGLVVVFAPGGVGVREVVYIWVLNGLYPHAQLQAAAITSRLCTVLAELTVLAVASLPVWPGAKAAKSVADTLTTRTDHVGEATEGRLR
jgi:hypothetical protein